MADRAPVLFTLEAEPKPTSVLDEEREKHRRRAERFGTDYQDPGRVRKDYTLMMEARKERAKREGFATGIDVFSQEEQDKRAARAARFNIEAPAALQYRPDEDLEAKARRAKKFGVPYQPTDAVLMDMDLFEQRREVGLDVDRRGNAIYLYGVDVMSTREVLQYFGDYGPTFVEWLDDSSCNVVFEDEASTKRAMVGKGVPLPPEYRQATDGQGEVLQPALPVPDDLTDLTNLPYIWHKGKDLDKAGTPISLVFRMATTADMRDPTAPKRTRELWKAGGGGGGGGGRGRGRGRGGGGGGRGGRKFARRDGQGGRPAGDGDGEEEDYMDMDDGPQEAQGDEGDVQMHRQRGVRGGQRQALKAVRRQLRPYGADALIGGQATAAAALAAAGPGLALDYTEVEDEPQQEAGAAAGHGGAGVDLRQVLKANRAAKLAAASGQHLGGGGADEASGTAADEGGLAYDVEEMQD